MGNSNACLRQFKKRRESRGGSTSIEETIQRSKSHWSQVVEFDSDEEEVAEVSNVEVFKTLQMHSTWGDFFLTFGEGEGRSLVMGAKFAEGGQAELYEAQVKWRHPKHNEEDLKYGSEWVLKVFNKGTSLRHLKSQWPRGYLQFHAERRECFESGIQPEWMKHRYNCDVHCGTLLKDGRFAFLMLREEGDLRSVIDCNMCHQTSRGPFSKDFAERIMYGVALRMDWLHSRNIVHKDLKASNVLVRKRNGRDSYYVADFECSIRVVGTGFFRAPEILQACKDGNVDMRPEIFTKAVDVYSYGMTCYEILTRKLPFEGHSRGDYDLVLNGQRPEVPQYVIDWACGLMSRCWQSNPEARLPFGEISDFLEANSAVVRESKAFLRRHRTGQVCGPFASKPENA